MPTLKGFAVGQLGSLLDFPHSNRNFQGVDQHPRKCPTTLVERFPSNCSHYKQIRIQCLGPLSQLDGPAAGESNLHQLKSLSSEDNLLSEPFRDNG